MNAISTQSQQCINATAQSNLQSTVAVSTSQGNNDISENFLNQLISVLSANGEQALAKQLKTNLESLGAQMNAEMLAVNPLLTAILAQQTSQEVSSSALAETETANALFQTQLLSPTVNATLSSEVISQLQDVITTTESLMTNDSAQLHSFSASLQSLANTNGLNATAISTTTADSSESTYLQAQSQFGQSIGQAQQILKEVATATSLDSEELDIEDLQKKVDSGEFLPHLLDVSQPEALAKSSGTDKMLDVQDIFNQIKSASTYYTENGATDFTIKLRPEGLGEITVNLLEEGGKITMSLAASHANVQHLLSNELTNLRDIMRPYNVEVAQVVQSNEAQSMNMQQQLQQQFSQHNYSRQQNAPPFTYTLNYDETAGSDESTQSVVLPQGVLNAYV